MNQDENPVNAPKELLGEKGQHNMYYDELEMNKICIFLYFTEPFEGPN